MDTLLLFNTYMILYKKQECFPITCLHIYAFTISYKCILLIDKKTGSIKIFTLLHVYIITHSHVCVSCKETESNLKERIGDCTNT